jgi:uncharacterized protein YbjQ (UPF0145 family)
MESELMGQLCNCLCFGLLLAIGLFAGTWNERRHYNYLERREAELARIPVTDCQRFLGGADPRAGGMIVTAEVVIASDYLKNFFATIRKIVGGELRAYQSLMERARREAIVRLKDQASQQGYNALCNIRLETVDLGSLAPRQQTAMVAVVVWATAYRMPVGK